MRLKMTLTMIAVSAAAIALAAAQATPPISYARDVEPVFLKACGHCHGADKPKKGLGLSNGRGYADLVGKPSQEVPDLDLVKPSDPASSYLWQKLSHTAREGKGMPRTLFGSKKLPQSDLDLVERWIKDGAQP
jgi:mono/diheme cytochrome c family protein